MMKGESTFSAPSLSLSSAASMIHIHAFPSPALHTVQENELRQS